MYKLVVLFVILLKSICIQSQVVSLKVAASAQGSRDGIHYRYKVESYKKDSGYVYINLNDSVVTANDKRYAIVTTPQHWNICRYFKWCTFMCCDDNYNKVFVKLFRQDNSNRSRIYIYEKDKAVRYLGTE